MPLIKKRPNEKLVPKNFRLPEVLVRRLAAYSRYTNVPETEILITALNHGIDLDREFVENHQARCIAEINTNSNTEPAAKKAAKHMSVPVAAGNDAAHP